MTGPRGEVRLTLPTGPGIGIPDQEVRLLFTNRALAQAEAASGLSVIQMVTAMSEKNVPMGLLAALLQASLEAARRDAGQKAPVSLDEAFAIIDELGYSAALLPVVTAVAGVFSRGVAEESDSPPAAPARDTGTGADS